MTTNRGKTYPDVSTSKLALKQERPYVITLAYDNGYFLISKPDSEDLLPVNAKWLKLYCSQSKVKVLFKACICKFKMYICPLHSFFRDISTLKEVPPSLILKFSCKLEAHCIEEEVPRASHIQSRK